MSTVSILPPASRGFSTCSNMTRAGCSLSPDCPLAGFGCYTRSRNFGTFLSKPSRAPCGLPVAVPDCLLGESGEVDPERGAELRQRGAQGARVAILRLQRDPEAVRGGGAHQALCSVLRDPTGNRSHQLRVGAAVAADELRTRPHRGRDPRAAAELDRK